MVQNDVQRLRTVHYTINTSYSPEIVKHLFVGEIVENPPIFQL